ncbi:MAG: MFS transporter, partial [Pseudomonas sp.]
YKAKNFIDTVVYRGGDALGGWVKRGLDALADHPQVTLMIAALIALGWGVVGHWLGRQYQLKEASKST